MARHAAVSILILILICGAMLPVSAFAHNVSKRDASFVQSN